jgi:hypothetical protein
MVIDWSRRLGVRQGGGAGPQNLAVGQLRQVLLDGIVQAQCALFHEQQNRARGGQLGIGIRPENVVGAQRYPLFAVSPADTLNVDQFGSAQQGPGRAGDQVLVDVALHRGADAGKIKPGGRDVQVVHGGSSPVGTTIRMRPGGPQRRVWPTPEPQMAGATQRSRASSV